MTICFFWKDGESENLGIFLKMFILLDENDRDELTAGNQSNIQQHL